MGCVQKQERDKEFRQEENDMDQMRESKRQTRQESKALNLCCFFLKESKRVPIEFQ